MKASKCVVTYDEYVGIGNLSVNGCAVDRDITCVIGYKNGKIDTEILRLDELAEGKVSSIVSMSDLEFIDKRSFSVLCTDRNAILIIDTLMYLKNKEINPVFHVLGKFFKRWNLLPDRVKVYPEKDRVNKIVYFPVYNAVFFI